MSRLRIYGMARTRAFRVLWVAEELGLDYELLKSLANADTPADVTRQIARRNRL
jgi:hypothetical protein